MFAQTNAPYPNRIQIVLSPFLGPFAQAGPNATFDPRRDLSVYADGQLLAVQTFSFDSINNRYLLYMSSAFNLKGVIQIVHHIPSPPFFGQASAPGLGISFGQEFGGVGSPSTANTVPGFALIAGFSSNFDN